MSVQHIPNHEKKAFRDMTPEERSAIVEAWIDGGVEVFGETEWAPAAHNFIVHDLPYRTRPRQLIIPWEHIKPEYKWAALNTYGSLVFYREKPSIGQNAWAADGGGDFGIPINIDTAGIDWRESLTARPEGV